MSHYPAVMLYHYSMKSVQQPDVSMKHPHYAVAELTDATAQLWVLLCVHVWMIPWVLLWVVGGVVHAGVGANLATVFSCPSCYTVLVII